MQKTAYIVLLSLLLPLVGQSQYIGRRSSWEVGAFLGVSNYQGDLAPDMVPSETHLALGIALRQNVNPYFAFTYELTYGRVSGNDNNFESLKTRNLSFYSDIVEIAPMVQFNFFHYALGLSPKHYTPYFMTGIAMFHFNPMTEYNGHTYTLQKLGTEGQGIVQGAPGKYQLWAFSVPMGLGMKFKINDQWNFDIHAAYRMTFTDYLDDVSGVYADRETIRQKDKIAAALSDRSGEVNGQYIGYPGRQRGNPDNNDGYFFAGVSLFFVIPPEYCPGF